MKRKVAGVLAAAMAAGMLAGCGSSAKPADTTAAKAEDTKAAEGSTEAAAADNGDKITIEFWHCMGSSNGELIQQITDSFNESQDKIFVKAVHQGSYTDAGTKMQAALAAGEAPVLAQMEIGMLGIFADADQLVDLQNFVDEENYDMSDFMPGLLDASYYDGALVALPHSRSVPVLYYNKDRFKEAGLTAILGCGFDPGVSGIYTAYAAKHYFDEIQYLDIVDCNAGNHHKAFATNFNPEINIREITQNGRYYENGKWVTTGPLEIHKDLTYPNIGPRDSYLLYHEELESLVKHYPTIKRARFWMTFGQEYLTHLRVIQNIGMARIDEVDYNGMKIVPLQFLKAVLPNPQDLGENYEGETSIGCRIRGLKDGKERTYYVYNNCSHQEAYQETGMQGVSYTTGVPAMIGAMMFFKGEWNRPGVNNVEEFNPDPFMEQLNKQGLPWHEEFDKDLEL